jgi:hypothetical protein
MKDGIGMRQRKLGRPKMRRTDRVKQEDCIIESCINETS